MPELIISNGHAKYTAGAKPREKAASGGVISEPGAIIDASAWAERLRTLIMMPG